MKKIIMVEFVILVFLGGAIANGYVQCLKDKIFNLENQVKEFQMEQEEEEKKAEAEEEAEEENPINKLNPIDEKLQNCKAENHSATGIKDCINKGIKSWDEEISKNNKEIKKLLSTENTELFDKSQALWQKYYTAENDFILKTFPETEDPKNNITASIIYDAKKAHALNINRYIMELKNQK